MVIYNGDTEIMTRMVEACLERHASRRRPTCPHPVESRDYYAELVECWAAEFRFTVTCRISAFGHIPSKSAELSRNIVRFCSHSAIAPVLLLLPFRYHSTLAIALICATVGHSKLLLSTSAPFR